jgi:hypothetical protein
LPGRVAGLRHNWPEPVGDATQKFPCANWPFTIDHFVVTVTPLLGGNMDFMKEENFDAQQFSLRRVHQCG